MWRNGGEAGAGSREMRPNGTGVVRSSGRRKVVDQDKPRRKEQGASSKNEKRDWHGAEESGGSIVQLMQQSYRGSGPLLEQQL